MIGWCLPSRPYFGSLAPRPSCYLCQRPLSALRSLLARVVHLHGRLRKFEERRLQFLWDLPRPAILQRNWNYPFDVLYHCRLGPVVVSNYCWPGTGICNCASFLLVISDCFIGGFAAGSDRFSGRMVCGERTTLRHHCGLVKMHHDKSAGTVTMKIIAEWLFSFAIFRISVSLLEKMDEMAHENLDHE